ncbi:hypothetical protein ACFOYW_04130 [Gryllotalpicola reticulitermitis]|uniref:Integral membrane protein n=1 Tax=Gryllotalpicola reticulitermitis TaxID=1184153 RepID=A0ABV8Q3N1_9MICO
MSDVAVPAARWRSALSVVLLVVVVVLVPLSLTARWAHATVTNTAGYLAAVQPVASDPEVQAAISDRITDTIVGRLDVPGVRALVQGPVERFVRSDAFASLWTAANREAHHQFVGVVTGEGTSALSVRDDTVSVDVGGVVASIRQSLVDQGVTIAERIPDIEIQFPIFESDHLVTAQRIFGALDRGRWLFPAAAIVCVAGAITVARVRLCAGAVAALCVALGTGLLALVIVIGRALYLRALPAAVPATAARVVFDSLVAPLWHAIGDVVAVAVAVAIVLGLTRLIAGRARSVVGQAARSPKL